MSELSSSSFGGLLESVSAKSPTPGGGAVASAVGALAGALGSMVVSYSIGKKSLVEHAGALESAAKELETAQSVLLTLADEDAAAYGELNAVWKLDKSDPARGAKMANAAELAIAPPLAVIATCVNLLRLFESLVGMTNRNLRSDLAIAAVLADAAVRASRWNVMVNMPLLGTDERREAVRAELAREVSECASRAAAVESGCEAD